MRRQNNEVRCAARERAFLLHAARNLTKKAFVEVAQHASPRLFAMVAVYFARDVLTAVASKAPTAVISKQEVIAQAMQDFSRPNEKKYSRHVARVFLVGRIATDAAEILTIRNVKALHNIAWFSMHMDGTRSTPRNSQRQRVS